MHAILYTHHNSGTMEKNKNKDDGNGIWQWHIACEKHTVTIIYSIFTRGCNASYLHTHNNILVNGFSIFIDLLEPKAIAMDDTHLLEEG